MNVFITLNLSRLSNLKTLWILDVESNNFTSLPPAMTTLHELGMLNLSHNSHLQSLDPRLLVLPHLEKVKCKSCTSLISPPYEVCKQGLEAIRKYYSDIKQSGGKKLPIVSAAVIGSRMAGKTSLINSLNSQRRQLTYRSEEGTDDDTAVKEFREQAQQEDDKAIKHLKESLQLTRNNKDYQREIQILQTLISTESF